MAAAGQAKRQASSLLDQAKDILGVSGLISLTGIGKLSLKVIKPERTIASMTADVHMLKDRRR